MTPRIQQALSVGVRQQTIGINGAWFNWYQDEMRRRKREAPAEMGAASKREQRWAKRQVAERARREWRDLEVPVREKVGANGKEQRKVAYTAGGRHLGVISRDSEERVSIGERLRVRVVVASDGNVRGVIVK